MHPHANASVEMGSKTQGMPGQSAHLHARYAGKKELCE
jgi:hypothetical protein